MGVVRWKGGGAGEVLKGVGGRKEGEGGRKMGVGVGRKKDG